MSKIFIGSALRPNFEQGLQQLSPDSYPIFSNSWLGVWLAACRVELQLHQLDCKFMIFRSQICSAIVVIFLIDCYDQCDTI